MPLLINYVVCILYLFISVCIYCIFSQSHSERACESAKDAAYESKEGMKEKMKNGGDSVNEKGYDMKESMKSTLHTMKEDMSESGQNMKEGMKDAVHWVADKVHRGADKMDPKV